MGGGSLKMYLVVGVGCKCTWVEVWSKHALGGGGEGLAKCIGGGGVLRM